MFLVQHSYCKNIRDKLYVRFVMISLHEYDTYNLDWKTVKVIGHYEYEQDILQFLTLGHWHLIWKVCVCVWGGGGAIIRGGLL